MDGDTSLLFVIGAFSEHCIQVKNELGYTRPPFVLAPHEEASLKWLFNDVSSEANRHVLMQRDVAVVRLLVGSRLIVDRQFERVRFLQKGPKTQVRHAYASNTHSAKTAVQERISEETSQEETW